MIKSSGKHLKWVINRGGDRKALIYPLLKAGIPFIIRSTGIRHIFYKGHLSSVKALSRKVKLTFQMTVLKVIIVAIAGIWFTAIKKMRLTL
ncbi:hypothetical protein KAJ27_04845 [bacterium]|nr:hypothetical protein [Candidatus Neomarinimicrobiota bacterium]MCK5683420.1 hypothetical protein [bacterium]